MYRGKGFLGGVKLANFLFLRRSLPAKSSNVVSQRYIWTSSNYNCIPSAPHLHINPRLGLFHCTATGPVSSHRCFSTETNVDKSVNQVLSKPRRPFRHYKPRAKFKDVPKTVRFIMQILENEDIAEARREKWIPVIKPGYIVEVKMIVMENKNLMSTIKGMVVAKRRNGFQTSIIIKRIERGIPCELLLHIYSPNIKEIKVVQDKKVPLSQIMGDRERMIKQCRLRKPNRWRSRELGIQRGVASKSRRKLKK